MFTDQELSDLADEIAANYINGNSSDVRKALAALEPLAAAAAVLGVLEVLNQQPGDADQRFVAAVYRWAEAAADR